MTITLEEIPSGDSPPSRRYEASEMRRQVVGLHFSRRTMMKAMLTGAMAMSLASLDAVSRLTKSYAATNWGDCPNWETRSDVTTDWKWCNPDGSSAGRIGQGYCGSDNFHRIGTIVDAPGGYYTEYRQRATSCTGRNAWAWFTNGVGPFPEPVSKRCSDGQVRHVTPTNPGSWLNSTCRRDF